LGSEIAGKPEFSHMKYDEIDPQMATPARVAILATLADGKSWLFADLRRETNLADGNLHVQTRRLKDAGYVAAEKVVRGGRRVTCFVLTDLGREALAGYVRKWGRVLRDAETTSDGGESARPARRRNDDSRVW